MAERDYMLVTTLTRLRAAEDLIRAAHPPLVVPDSNDDWIQTLILVRGWVENLEGQVEKSRNRRENKA